MDKDYSIDALNRFLDQAASKGWMKKNTAQARKAAANKVLQVLDSHELQDLRNVDVAEVFERFQNLQGMEYKPESLQVYLSRTKTAVSDFISYVDDPSNFKFNSRSPSPPKTENKKNLKKQIDSGGAVGEQDRPVSYSHVDVPVMLRPNVRVQIINLPSDLTPAEAERLAAIVKAYAVPET